MSTNTSLRAVAEGKTEVATKAPTLAQLLTSPKTLAQIKAALPKHMTAERQARIALTEVRKTPKLAKCEAVTYVGAVITLSQLGLEPGGPLGHAYLIPFENKRKGTVEVQLVIGYRGMIDLARRSGQIASIQATIVRDGDEFSAALGLNPTLHHVPSFDPSRPMGFVYAVAVFKDGARQFEVMSRAEVEKIRDQSQGYKSAVQFNKTDNPWMTHFDEMAKKTVIRRLFKYLPVSIELQQAVALDERGEAGLSQDIDDAGAIDGTATEIDDEAKQLPDKSETESTDAAKKVAQSETFTYPEVRQEIEAAIKKKDRDALDLAQSKIASLPDQFRAELNDLANKGREGFASQ